MWGGGHCKAARAVQVRAGSAWSSIPHCCIIPTLLPRNPPWWWCRCDTLQFALFKPTPTTGWWGAAMFASAGLMECLEDEDEEDDEEVAQQAGGEPGAADGKKATKAKKRGRGFDEDDQAALYKLVRACLGVVVVVVIVVWVYRRTKVLVCMHVCMHMHLHVLLRMSVHVQWYRCMPSVAAWGTGRGAEAGAVPPRIVAAASDPPKPLRCWCLFARVCGSCCCYVTSCRPPLCLSAPALPTALPGPALQVQDNQRVGRRGLGKGELKVVAGAKWEGTKKTFGDDDVEGGEEEGAAAADGAQGQGAAGSGRKGKKGKKGAAAAGSGGKEEEEVPVAVAAADDGDGRRKARKARKGNAERGDDKGEEPSAAAGSSPAEAQQQSAGGGGAAGEAGPAGAAASVGQQPKWLKLARVVLKKVRAGGSAACVRACLHTCAQQLVSPTAVTVLLGWGVRCVGGATTRPYIVGIA